jgi:hypothetical protein
MLNVGIMTQNIYIYSSVAVQLKNATESAMLEHAAASDSPSKQKPANQPNMSASCAPDASAQMDNL